MAENTSSSSINGGRTVKQCQTMIQKCLRDPMVKLLREHMEKAGCPVGNKFIRAFDCKGTFIEGSRGFYASGVGIVVCSNAVRFQDDVNQVVIHELIHAFDDCRAANFNTRNCAHHACTEIRAYNLSGNCHYKRELLQGFTKIRGHGQECVRRKVLESLQGYPCCSGVAKDAMDAVWDVCYNDTQPFDRAP